MSTLLCWMLWKANGLQRSEKNSSTKPTQNLEWFGIVLVLGFWAFSFLPKKAAAAIDGFWLSKAQKLCCNYILIFICLNSVNACKIYDIWRLLGLQVPGDQIKDKTLHNSTNRCSFMRRLRNLFITLVSAFRNWTIISRHLVFYRQDARNQISAIRISIKPALFASYSTI